MTGLSIAGIASLVLMGLSVVTALTGGVLPALYLVGLAIWTRAEFPADRTASAPQQGWSVPHQ